MMSVKKCRRILSVGAAGAAAVLEGRIHLAKIGRIIGANNDVMLASAIVGLTQHHCDCAVGAIGVVVLLLLQPVVVGRHW